MPFCTWMLQGTQCWKTLRHRSLKAIKKGFYLTVYDSLELSPLCLLCSFKPVTVWCRSVFPSEVFDILYPDVLVMLLSYGLLGDVDCVPREADLSSVWRCAMVDHCAIHPARLAVVGSVGVSSLAGKTLELDTRCSVQWEQVQVCIAVVDIF